MRTPILTATALALLAGCGTTPENRYYTLSVEPSKDLTAPARRPEQLSLAKIRLPGITDRPQLVVRTGAQTVDIREFDRWAEPLDQLVPRILARDLALREGTPNPNVPERRLFVTIDEFSADSAGPSQLTGRWWTLDPNEDSAKKRERPFAFSWPAEAKDGSEVAASMSALLGLLADDIARE
jgi:uncharacterized lipoprotein YmbA